MSNLQLTGKAGQVDAKARLPALRRALSVKQDRFAHANSPYWLSPPLAKRPEANLHKTLTESRSKRAAWRRRRQGTLSTCFRPASAWFFSPPPPTKHATNAFAHRPLAAPLSGCLSWSVVFGPASGASSSIGSLRGGPLHN